MPEFSYRTASALLMCYAFAATAQVPQAPGIPRVTRPLVLRQNQYRLRAGESVRIDAPPETLDFLLHAQTRSVEIDGKEAHGIVVGPNRAGDQILLAASLRMKPGEYTVKLSAVNEANEEGVTTLAVTLNPMQTVPITATQPPVVLLNGWQFGINSNSLSVGSCPVSSGPSDTFGTLAGDLQTGNGVPVVYFFDNCVEDPNGRIEDLGNVLGQVLGLIRYDTGALAAQVDLVAHSMGGLIVRSYLSGLQDDGSLLPLVNPRIRKAVLIATPNFGSFLAENWASSLPTGTQSAEMIPGSAFLWNLARWNQGGDDLRGVDALAIVGNYGYKPASSNFPPANASDGVVSVSSASLGFVRDATRTRILPYCHKDFDWTVQAVAYCEGSGIAKAPETEQIVESFLANTPNWMSIGGTPATDPYLSQYGGVYFAVETAADQYLNDISSVLWGNSNLSNGGATNIVFYNEFVGGTGSFQAASASLNQVTYGPVTVPAGRYTAFRAKFSPVISSVAPLLGNTLAWVVESGATITIDGAGFGQQQCSGCQVLAAPSGSTSGYSLPVSSWSNQAITASFLPASMPNLTIPGLVTIYVELSASAWDSIDIMAAPAPILTIAKSHTGSFKQGQNGCSYQVVVSNQAGAGPTIGTVTVTETVPSGLTLASMMGTGWTCPTGGNTCTRSDFLAAGASYPAITATVNVAANASSPQVNAVSVSGGGSVGAIANDSTIVTGISCSYSISPTSLSMAAAGGSGTIAVTAPTGCPWTASGSLSWVSVTSGASGTGNGAVTVQVAANSGVGRSGSLTVAGLPFTVGQASATVGGLVFAGSMAQIASAGGWDTSLTLVNLGAAQGEARLNFYANNGSAPQLPFTFPQQPALGSVLASTLDQNLNAGAMLVLDTTGPAGQTTATGWSQLLTSGNIGAFAIFDYTPTGQQAVVPVETRNAASYLLAFDDTGALATGLAIANLTASPASVGVVIRDDTGAKIGTGAISLPAEGHNSFMLTDPTYGFAATANKRGTVEFDTPPNGAISVLGLRANGAAITTLPVLANVGTAGGAMAHVASGGGWQTIFTLVNTGTASANATLSFFADGGSPLSLPLSYPQTGAVVAAQSVSQTIPAGATLVIVTQGQSTGASVTGSAQLTTNGNVSGFAIFQNSGQEAVVPLEVGSASSYTLAFDNTGSLATGIALANSSAQPASVPATLRSDTGATLATTTVNLPANGHRSFMLTDPTYGFPAAANIRGTVEFDTPSGGQIGALGIRATPSGAYTTIPVMTK